MSVWFHSNPSSRTVMTTPFPVNPFCHTGITWRSSLGRDGVILVSCCCTEGIKIHQNLIHLYQIAPKSYFEDAVNNFSLNLSILLKFCKYKTKIIFIQYLWHWKIYPTAWISWKTISEQKNLVFLVSRHQKLKCTDESWNTGLIIRPASVCSFHLMRSQDSAHSAANWISSKCISSLDIKVIQSKIING